MNGRPLTVGSLFSGIGGFDLGFERAGMSTRWFCEQDEFCTRVLNKHWPDVPVYPDITDLRGQDVEPVDVLCGGFPCQDLSLAGKGAGLAGERSGLWSEYARLVGELRPSYVVVENVAALLGRGLGSVLGDLSALGYDAEWDCIPASAVGAPHQRDRLWIVAYPNADRGGLEVVEERDGGATESELEAPLGCDVDGFRDDVADPAGVVGQRVFGAGGPGGEPEEPARDSSGDCGARAVGDSYGLVGAAPEFSAGRSGRGGRTGAFKRAVGSGGVRGEVQDSDGGSLLPWRVGGRVAQAGGSEWWAVEPGLGRSFDGFSAWLDGYEHVRQPHELVSAYADACGRSTTETLRVLRSADGAEEVERALGGCGGISSSALLLAYLCELANRCDEGNAALPSSEAAWASLRSVRGDYKFARPSRRSEPGEQHAGERADALQTVSRLLARDAEAAWLAYRRSDACPPLNFEAGIARVSHGVPDRLARLSALGNALVPQIAEWIGRRIVAYETEQSLERVA